MLPSVRRTWTFIRTVLLSTLLAALCGVALAGPANAATSRSCGSIRHWQHGGGTATAYRIVATRVTCDHARNLARACLLGYHEGWLPFWEERTDQYGVTYDETILRRGRAHVSFRVMGGTGCVQ